MRGATYTVSFTKAGYTAQDASMPAQLETGWYLAGNLVWGFIGAPIGWFIVDPITGNMYKVDDMNVYLAPAVNVDSSPVQPTLSEATPAEAPTTVKQREYRTITIDAEGRVTRQ